MFEKKSFASVNCYLDLRCSVLPVGGRIAPLSVHRRRSFPLASLLQPVLTCSSSRAPQFSVGLGRGHNAVEVLCSGL